MRRAAASPNRARPPEAIDSPPHSPVPRHRSPHALSSLNEEPSSSNCSQSRPMSRHRRQSSRDSGLLSQVSKLEAMSEDRAMQVIHMRVLVLKLEKEREDALDAVRRMEAQAAAHKEELSSALAELAILRREQTRLRMTGLSGLVSSSSLHAPASSQSNAAGSPLLGPDSPSHPASGGSPSHHSAAGPGVGVSDFWQPLPAGDLVSEVSSPRQQPLGRQATMPAPLVSFGGAPAPHLSRSGSAGATDRAEGGAAPQAQQQAGEHSGGTALQSNLSVLSRHSGLSVLSVPSDDSGGGGGGGGHTSALAARRDRPGLARLVITQEAAAAGKEGGARGEEEEEEMEVGSIDTPRDGGIAAAAAASWTRQQLALCMVQQQALELQAQLEQALAVQQQALRDKAAAEERLGEVQQAKDKAEAELMRRMAAAAAAPALPSHAGAGRGGGRGPGGGRHHAGHPRPGSSPRAGAGVRAASQQQTGELPATEAVAAPDVLLQLQEAMQKLREDNEHALGLRQVEIEHLKYQQGQHQKEKQDALQNLLSENNALHRELRGLREQQSSQAQLVEQPTAVGGSVVEPLGPVSRPRGWKARRVSEAEVTVGDGEEAGDGGQQRASTSAVAAVQAAAVVAAAGREVDEMRAALREAREAGEGHRREVAALRRRVSELEAVGPTQQQPTLSRDLDGAAATAVAAAEAALKAAREQVESLERSLTEKEKDKAWLHTRVMDLEAAAVFAAAAASQSLGQLQGRVEEAEGRAREAQVRAEAAEARAREEKARAGELEGQLESVRQEVEGLRDRYASVERHDVELASEAGSLRKEVAGTQARLQQAVAELEGLRGRLGASEADVAGLRAAVELRGREAEEGVREAAAARAELERARGRERELEGSLSRALAEAASASEQAAALSAQLRASTAEADAERAAASALAARLRGEKEAEEAKGREARELVKAMTGQLTALQASLEAQSELSGSLREALDIELERNAHLVEALEQEGERTTALGERLGELEHGQQRRVDALHRQLTASRIKLSDQTREAARQGTGAGSTGSRAATGPSKAESQAVFRKLKDLVRLYRLNVGPTLQGKMQSEASNTATEEQVWQAVHAVMTALELQGPHGGSSRGSPRANSPTPPPYPQQQQQQEQQHPDGPQRRATLGASWVGSPSGATSPQGMGSRAGGGGGRPRPRSGTWGPGDVHVQLHLPLVAGLEGLDEQGGGTLAGQRQPLQQQHVGWAQLAGGPAPQPPQESLLCMLSPRGVVGGGSVAGTGGWATTGPSSRDSTDSSGGGGGGSRPGSARGGGGSRPVSASSATGGGERRLLPTLSAARRAAAAAAAGGPAGVPGSGGLGGRQHVGAATAKEDASYGGGVGRYGVLTLSGLAASAAAGPGYSAV